VVRFGNVLGSRGSVVPLFQRQIAAGGPVTVTDPAATRYFMTIPEAVRLVIQAGAMGKGGEVFVLDMGQPVCIHDLACDLIRLHGLEPERDIPLQVIGLRPGEKLHEKLCSDGERAQETAHPAIRVAKGNPQDGTADLEASIAELEQLATERRLPELRARLLQVTGRADGKGETEA
jgi:FlaA1/EpsC-like NDP-sugar epimerase